MIKWWELKVYKTGEDTGEMNMQKILTHVDKFILVICRDEEGKLRVYIRAKPEHRSTLDSLTGVEVVNAVPFDFTGYKKYRKYRMRRHCAIPIIPKTMERTSPYGVIYSETSAKSFVALYARKLDTAQPISEYIACLERGQNPTSIFRHLSGGGTTKKISTRARTKIRAATEKIETRSISLCRVITGTMSRNDTKAIEGMFPVKAFTPKTIKEKHLEKLFSTQMSLPLFGASKCIILSDVEFLGFMAMPDQADMANINFDFGKIASESAGVPSGSID